MRSFGSDTGAFVPRSGKETGGLGEACHSDRHECDGVAEFAYIMANYGSIDAFMQSYMATMDELTDGSYSQMYEMYGY